MVEALRVVDLSFRYAARQRLVLDGVDLVVGRGDSLGILGVNGSGKSTLLGAVTGTVHGVRSGQIEVDGSSSFPPTEVGYAPQDISLYQLLTVRENIEHVARLTLPSRKVAAAIDRSIEEFGLGRIVDHAIHVLSGGQKRLVHLAVSFVHDPPVRFLDEPTTALDFSTRQRLVELVRSWRRRAVAVVVTAHYPEDIEDLCDDLVLLREGRCQRLGNLRSFLATRDRTLRIVVRTPDDSEQVLELTDVTAGAVARSLEAVGESSTEIVEAHFSRTSLRTVLTEDPDLARVVMEVKRP